MKRHNFLVAVLGIMALIAATRVLFLDRFPVFADEAIYIRWAQLISDDWRQYLFFAMIDGKTPLFIWMLNAFQWLHPNQLVAARLLSASAAFVQALLIAAILQRLGARKLTQLLGMLLVTVLPFWVTYHRIALMDGWLTVWLSAAFLSGLVLAQYPTQQLFPWQWPRKTLMAAAALGLSLGAALWTKLPALFFVPVLLWIPLFFFLAKTEKKKTLGALVQSSFPYIGAVGFGLLLLITLRISPVFGQLFSRGQDFTFSAQELLQGKWLESFANMARFTGYFMQYFTWPVLVAVVAGLFSERARKNILLLLISAGLFLAPFALLGKVVHPRYLLPVSIFVTVAAVLSIEAYVQKIMLEKRLPVRLGLSLVLATLFGQVVTASSLFLVTYLTQPDATPFVVHDRTQYLEEWSSGHGLVETVGLIEGMMKTQRVAVATEGRFGSLPDGLLLYFHGRDVENLYLEGIGQYPVKSLPEFFIERAVEFDRVILVVNSHRMELPIEPQYKLEEFCRPRNAPCLQVWDVTHLIKPEVASPAPSTQTLSP